MNKNYYRIKNPEKKSEYTNQIEKIGTILGIQDKNNDWLYSGDYVTCGSYEGRIFLEKPMIKNSHKVKYAMIALNYSMWYGDNEFDLDSYGKFIYVKLDNGSKMDLERLFKYDEKCDRVIHYKPGEY